MAKTSFFYFFAFITLFLCKNLCTATEEIKVYELKKDDFSLKITNYGATVISVILPDKNGKLDDVVLGYDSIDDYKNDTTYFGGFIGRVANRIGGAKFKLNGVEYKLPANDHGNTLHGGSRGFSSVIWTVEDFQEDSHLTLTYNSFDGEQGFPGDLSVKVTYMFIETNKLALIMQAKPLNKATPVNLASHTYWNLGGHNSGDILSQTIQIFGSKITPVNDKLIPNGEITPVKGTGYDFLQPRTIGSKLNEIPGGYDINYVLDNTEGKHLQRVAIVQESKSGRKMELWSNKPGVQFYTSNMLDNVKGKGGFVYSKYAALCLETQGFPDSVNHIIDRWLGGLLVWLSGPHLLLLYGLMVGEVHGGHKQNKSFSKKGWKCICDEFHKRTGLTWEKEQLKYRYAALRKLFATMKLLLDHTDFKWDETTGLVTATDEAWDQYIKEHPDVETIRSTGCPFYKGLSVIFADSGTHNGSTMHKDRLLGSSSHPQPSTLPQEELSNSESEESPDSNEQEIVQSVSSPTDTCRKRRRNGVDGAIARAISEMAAASRLRASAIDKYSDNFTITDCIRALDELEGVNDQVYYAALDLFNNHAAREIFLSLNVGKRLTWLIGKLSGPP